MNDIEALSKEWTIAKMEETTATNYRRTIEDKLVKQLLVPESFEEGILILAAESTTWATQVRLMLPQLRKNIDAAVGTGVVSDIRIQGPQGPSWKSGPRHVKGRGPRDTYG